MSISFIRRQNVINLARDWRGPQGVVSRDDPLPVIDVEKLLRWAYRDELPKTPRMKLMLAAGPRDSRGTGAVKADQAGELWAVIENDFGVVPDPFAAEGPHADARAVHEAVCALDAVTLDLPDDWSPLADLGDLHGHAAALCARAMARLTKVDPDGARRLRASPRRLIMYHAIMGGIPDWEIEPPAVEVVKTANGMPRWFVKKLVPFDGPCGRVENEVEVDGFDRKRRVPVDGAYQKTVLEPDPTDGVVARAEWEVWRAALDLVTEDLRGRLTKWDVVASSRPVRPWETPMAEGRVLREGETGIGWGA